MANSNIDKLIEQALRENSTPRKEFAAKLEQSIDRMAETHRLRRLRRSWVMGGIAASILAAAIIVPHVTQEDQFYAQDTFDNPQEAAQFMASMLGSVTKEVSKGVENGLYLFINEFHKINDELTNNQKNNENES